jgi:hypothetical protein
MPSGGMLKPSIVEKEKHLEASMLTGYILANTHTVYLARVSQLLQQQTEVPLSLCLSHTQM